MGPVVYFGLCLLGCLAFSPSAEGIRNQSLPRPRSPCPPGALYYQSTCYEYLVDFVSWQEAEDSCLYWRGGHLASIQSMKEEKDISEYIGKIGGINRVWIGFHSKLVSSKFTWGWSDGVKYVPGSALWDNRRPSTSSSYDQCVALRSVQDSTGSIRWWQYSCSTRYPYLCKYRAAF